MNGKRRRNFESSLFVASNFPLNLPRAKNTVIEFESTDASWTLRSFRVNCMTKLEVIFKIYLSDKIITYDRWSRSAPCYPIHNATLVIIKKTMLVFEFFTCKIVTTLSLPANKAPLGNTNLSSVSSRIF